MTLDMLEILIDSIVRSLEKFSQAEYYAGMFLIACALGIGTGWAAAMTLKDFSYNFFSNLL